MDAILDLLVKSENNVALSKLLVERIQEQKKKEFSRLVINREAPPVVIKDEKPKQAPPPYLRQTISDGDHVEGMRILGSVDPTDDDDDPDNGSSFLATCEEQDRKREVLSSMFDAMLSDLSKKETRTQPGTSSPDSSSSIDPRASTGSITSSSSNAESDITDLDDRDTMLMMSFRATVDKELSMLCESVHASTCPENDEAFISLVDKWNTRVEKAREVKGSKIRVPVATTSVSANAFIKRTDSEESIKSDKSHSRPSTPVPPSRAETSAMKRFTMRLRGRSLPEQPDSSIVLSMPKSTAVSSPEPPSPRARRGSVIRLIPSPRGMRRSGYSTPERKGSQITALEALSSEK